MNKDTYKKSEINLDSEFIANSNNDITIPNNTYVIPSKDNYIGVETMDLSSEANNNTDSLPLNKENTFNLDALKPNLGYRNALSKDVEKIVNSNNIDLTYHNQVLDSGRDFNVNPYSKDEYNYAVNHYESYYQSLINKLNQDATSIQTKIESLENLGTTIDNYNRYLDGYINDVDYYINEFTKNKTNADILIAMDKFGWKESDRNKTREELLEIAKANDTSYLNTLEVYKDYFLPLKELGLISGDYITTSEATNLLNENKYYLSLILGEIKTQTYNKETIKYDELLNTKDFLEVKDTLGKSPIASTKLDNDRFELLSYMNDYDKKYTLIYNYLYTTEGEDSAIAYIDTIKDEMNQFAGMQKFEERISKLKLANSEDLKLIEENYSKLDINNSKDIKDFLSLVDSKIEDENVKNLIKEFDYNDNENLRANLEKIVEEVNGVSKLKTLSLTNFVLTSTTGFGDGLYDFAEGFQKIFSKGETTVQDYEEMYYANYLAQHSNLYDDIYGVGQGVGNMLPTTITGAILYATAPEVAPFVTSGMIGLSSFGTTKNEMLVEGYEAKQAILYAALTSSSDAILEALLGGIEGVGINSFMKNAKGSFGEVAIGLLKSMAQEGTEEVIQDLFKSVAIDTIVLGKSFDVGDFSEQSIKTFIQSALVAGILNGATTTAKFSYLGVNYELNPSEVLKVTEMVEEGLTYKQAVEEVMSIEGKEFSGRSKVDNIVNMLSSNLNKYSYLDTNSIEGLNEQIKENGLYHFTNNADEILESGVINASNMLDSYGRRKAFMFNGVPEIGAFATNLDSIPLKTTAVKIDPTTELLNSSNLQVRYRDDQAISYNGNLELDGLNASKAYFVLERNGDNLSYKEVSKEVYDNYESSTEGKELSSYISDNENINKIKQDYYEKIHNNENNSLNNQTVEQKVLKFSELYETNSNLDEVYKYASNNNLINEFKEYLKNNDLEEDFLLTVNSKDVDLTKEQISKELEIANSIIDERIGKDLANLIREKTNDPLTNFMLYKMGVNPDISSSQTYQAVSKLLEIGNSDSLIGIHRIGSIAETENFESSFFTDGIALTGHLSSGSIVTVDTISLLSQNISLFNNGTNSNLDSEVVSGKMRAFIEQIAVGGTYKNDSDNGAVMVISIPNEVVNNPNNDIILTKDGHNYLNPKYIAGYANTNNNYFSIDSFVENNYQENNISTKQVTSPNYLDKLDSAANLTDKQLEGIEIGLQSLSNKLGVSTEEIKEILDLKVKELIDDSEFGVRVNENALSGILDSGLKNQFETKSSGGALNTTKRMGAEGQLFNVPDAANLSDRPVYGMAFPKYHDYSQYYKRGPGAFYAILQERDASTGKLKLDDQGHGIIAVNPETNKRYSSAVILLNKDNIKNNTTFTIGDSLDVGFNRLTLDAVIGSSRTSNPSYRGGSMEVFDSIDSLEDLKKATLEDLFPTSDYRSTRYMELQIHGQDAHTIDNIREVIFTSGEVSDSIIAKLEDKNIPYRIMPCFD